MAVNLPDPKSWSTTRGFRKHAPRSEARKACPNGSTLKRCENDWDRSWGYSPGGASLDVESNLPLALSPLQHHLGRKKVNAANVGKHLESILSETNVSQVLLSKRAHSQGQWRDHSYYQRQLKLIYELKNNDVEDQIYAYNKTLSNYVKSQQKIKPNYKQVYSKRVHLNLRQKRKSERKNRGYVPVAIDEPRLKAAEVTEKFAEAGHRGLESIIFDFGDNKYFTAFGTDWTWRQSKYWRNGLICVTIGRVDDYVIEFAVDRDAFDSNLDKYHLMSKMSKQSEKMSKGKKQKYAKDDAYASVRAHLLQRGKLMKEKKREIVFEKFGKYNGTLNIEKSIDEKNYEAIYEKYKQYDTSKSSGHCMTLSKTFCVDRNYQRNLRNNLNNGKDKIHNGIFARYIRVTLDCIGRHRVRYLNNNLKDDLNEKFKVVYEHENKLHMDHIPRMYFANMFHFYGYNLDLLGRPIVPKNDKFMSETRKQDDMNRDGNIVDASRVSAQETCLQIDKVMISAETELSKQMKKMKSDGVDGIKYCTVTITDRGRRLRHCNKRSGQRQVAPRNTCSPEWGRRDKRRLSNAKEIKQQMIECKRLISSGNIW